MTGTRPCLLSVLLVWYRFALYHAKVVPVTIGAASTTPTIAFGLKTTRHAKLYCLHYQHFDGGPFIGPVVAKFVIMGLLLARIIHCCCLCLCRLHFQRSSYSTIIDFHCFLRDYANVLSQDFSSGPPS